jgi:hypothetical protein
MHRVLLLAVLAIVLAGCGGSSTTPAAHTATSLNGLRADAAGTDGLSVCALLPRATVEQTVGVDGLRAVSNDSLDLSQCRYATADVNVRVLLDGGAQAQLRYFNQQAEAQEKFSRDPAMRPRLVSGVGDDRAPGAAGAYWTRARHELVAIDAGRIARVTVNVPGRAEQVLKGQAGTLTRDLFAAVQHHR